MHFSACPIHCKVHWKVGRMLESCRLISEQHLIRSTIKAFFKALSCEYWRFCVDYTDTVSVKPITARYGGWLSEWTIWRVRSKTGHCFGPVIVPPVHFGAFSFLENKLIGYADDSILMAVVPSPGVRVTVAKSLISVLGRISEWCDIWLMKLNASKAKTMIVSRSRRMQPQSPPLTIGWTVLNESDDLAILGLTYLIPKWLLRSILASFLEQLLKDLVSWGSPAECSKIDHFLGDASVFCPANFGVLRVFQCGARLPIHTLNYCMDRAVSGAGS